MAKAKRFTRTIGAMRKEVTAAWDIVEAMSAELEFDGDDLARGQLKSLTDAARSAGVEVSYKTLRLYAHGAVCWVLTDARDRKVIRDAMGATTLGTLKSGGFSPEAIAGLARNGPGTISKTEAEALVGDLEQSDDEEKPETNWEAELLKHGRGLLRALNNLHGHEFADPMAELMFGLWQPRTVEVDWDAEFAALVEGN